MMPKRFGDMPSRNRPEPWPGVAERAQAAQMAGQAELDVLERAKAQLLAAVAPADQARAMELWEETKVSPTHYGRTDRWRRVLLAGGLITREAYSRISLNPPEGQAAQPAESPKAALAPEPAKRARARGSARR